MLDALETHAIETGCDVSAFVVPTDRADCICAACGTVVYEGPEFEPDA
jgi:transcription initiation factor TFIIIB Brf1 subunit/transcription initiation factor TFIIB